MLTSAVANTASSTHVEWVQEYTQASADQG